MLFDTALSGLQARVAILESVVEILSGFLAPPKLFVSEVVRGFRYKNPDVRHFCLLKAVRAVSALNAAIELARKGYTQELAVLMRIVTECTKRIEYVLDMDDTEEHRSNVKTYLRKFFRRHSSGAGGGDQGRSDPRGTSKRAAWENARRDFQAIRRHRGTGSRRSVVLSKLPGFFVLCSRKIPRSYGPLWGVSWAMAFARHGSDAEGQRKSGDTRHLHHYGLHDICNYGAGHSAASRASLARADAAPMVRRERGADRAGLT